ncbi:MAG: DMT family transporter [Acidobacteria bacterium]|nr:DMT family transporter [Acidobacteriota bacterium]
MVAAALFSTGGAAIKACGLTDWQIAGFRSGIAALTIALLLPEARRRWSWRTLLVGCAYASCLMSFALANKLTTAAHTIFLQSTAPLYLLLLGPLLLREPVRRRDLGYLAALVAGLLMLLFGIAPAQATAPDPVRGNILAAFSGLSWALSVSGLRWLGRDGGGATALGAALAGNMIAFLVALPLALPLGAGRPVDWLVLAYLGVFQIAVAYVFLTRGLTRLPALEASLLLLVEPVLNPVFTWLVHGETPGAWAVAGGAVILGATLVHTWRASRA